MKNVKLVLCTAVLAGGALVAGPLTSASGAPSTPVKPSGPGSLSTITGTPVSIAPGTYGSLVVTCVGAGKKISGGGGSTSGYDIDLLDSFPSGNGWVVGGFNRGTSSQTLTGYAVCLGLS